MINSFILIIACSIDKVTIIYKELCLKILKTLITGQINRMQYLIIISHALFDYTVIKWNINEMI